MGGWWRVVWHGGEWNGEREFKVRQRDQAKGSIIKRIRRDGLPTFHGSLEGGGRKAIQVHDSLLESSLLLKSLEYHDIEAGNLILAPADSLLHRHQRLYHQVELLRNQVDCPLYFRRHITFFRISLHPLLHLNWLSCPFKQSDLLLVEGAQV